MKPLLLEPTDVLFFRDAVPMSAGQGKGAGCRMPFPSTLHEAFRTSLLLASDKIPNGKKEQGRPRHAPKRRNWHDKVWPEQDRRFIATPAFRSLRTIGPLPFLEFDREGKPFTWDEERCQRKTGFRVTYSGLLLPVPLDAAFEFEHRSEIRSDGSRCDWQQSVSLRRLHLLRDDAITWPTQATHPATFRPLCLPVAVTPPDKHGQLHGWWAVEQYAAYLSSVTENQTNDDSTGKPTLRFRPLPGEDLWQAEHRIGVEIDPRTFASAQSRLYSGSYLRAHSSVRFAVQVCLGDDRTTHNGEGKTLSDLSWLLLGGERRLARVWHDLKNDPFTSLPPAPAAKNDGPCLLKWILVTPAIFAHGSLPGWCWNAKDGRPVGEVRLGASQRKKNHESLPGRAQLVSWCLGKPLVVSGWDVVEGCAKPTMLAAPAGSVYYFLCENRNTANTLAQKLHWQPRSDFYGEKGCGYGLVSFDAQMHRTSATVEQLAKEILR